MKILLTVAFYIVMLWSLITSLSIIPILCASGKLLSKADEPWWYILIPVYGIYKVYAIADSAIVFWASILFTIINILAVLVHNGYTWVAWLFSIASIILYIIFALNLANAFNKSKKFAIGLILLPGVFMCILGFGNAYHVDTMFRHRHAKSLRN